MSDREAWITFAAAAYAAWLAAGDHNKHDCLAYAVDDADALLIELNKRHPLAPPAEPTPPQPDDDGWIKWEGGECPVPLDTRVHYRCADGYEGDANATHVRWWHARDPSDVVAYRIVYEAGVTK